MHTFLKGKDFLLSPRSSVEIGEFSDFYVESCLQPSSSSFAEKEETGEVYQYSFQENQNPLSLSG